MQLSEFEFRARSLALTGAQRLPAAVVLGVGPTGLAIARTLKRRGIPVIGVDDAAAPVTRHSSSFYFLESRNFFDEAAFTSELIRLAGQLPLKPVLFCSGDEHVAMLARQRDRLAAYYHFEVPSCEQTEVLLRKDRFAQLAQQQNWPIPRTHHVDSVGAVRSLEQLAYPVILKPALKNRATRENAPSKTFLCHSAGELDDAYQKLAAWEPEAVIQEWIPGGDNQIFFTFHYLAGGSIDLGGFCGRKLRQYPPHGGSTSYAEPAFVPDLAGLSLEILRHSGACGFCSVEYKYDTRSDRYVIMEPTIGRVNLQVSLAIVNGHDFISAAYGHMTGALTAESYVHPKKQPRRWMLVPQDLRSARYYIRRGELSLRDYIGSLRPPVTLWPLSFREPWLSLNVLAELSHEILGVLIRRRTRGTKIPDNP